MDMELFTVTFGKWHKACSRKKVGVFLSHLVRFDGHCFGYWTENVIVKRTSTLYYTTL